MTEKKSYEAIIEVQMPGQTKTNGYKIIVHDADGLVDATQKAIAEWKSRTDPKDVRVKEIVPVVTAS